jgi:hypothetical protein
VKVEVVAGETKRGGIERGAARKQLTCPLHATGFERNDGNQRSTCAWSFAGKPSEQIGDLVEQTRSEWGYLERRQLYAIEDKRAVAVEAIFEPATDPDVTDICQRNLHGPGALPFSADEAETVFRYLEAARDDKATPLAEDHRVPLSDAATPPGHCATMKRPQESGIRKDPRPPFGKQPKHEGRSGWPI